jgi:hypothetical protein
MDKKNLTEPLIFHIFESLMNIGNKDINPCSKKGGLDVLNNISGLPTPH